MEDKDLAQAITKVPNIVNFLDRPNICVKYGLKKSICEQTAHKWMKKMGYRWSVDLKGQYVDGHECEDVINFWQNVFLLGWASAERYMRTYTHAGEEEPSSGESGRCTVIWFLDKSTFYAHDHQRKWWIHKDTNPVPYAIGEGASLMVADFVSADYGYLRSRDGKHSACQLFTAGKNRDGYFTNTKILKQVKEAMDIVKESYPDNNHLFIYDNATTHLKCADDALSEYKMPKNPSKTWGIEVNQLHPDGKQVFTADGKYTKMKIQMGDGTFNGMSQLFYSPEGHEKAGWFKGMVTILEEHCFANALKLKAQCKDFKCAKGATSCCCC